MGTFSSIIKHINCFTVSWYPIKSMKVFTKFKFNVRFELKEIKEISTAVFVKTI